MTGTMTWAATDVHARSTYETGPTGFGLYRATVAAGVECQVIAPSKTPRPFGDRGDRSAWTKVHREWLHAQRFAHHNTELALIDNLTACDG